MFLAAVPESQRIGECRRHYCVPEIEQYRKGEAFAAETRQNEWKHKGIVDDHGIDQYGPQRLPFYRHEFCNQQRAQHAADVNGYINKG